MHISQKLTLSALCLVGLAVLVLTSATPLPQQFQQRGQRGSLADILHEFAGAPVRLNTNQTGYVVEIIRNKRGQFPRVMPGNLVIHSVGTDYVLLHNKNGGHAKFDAEDQTYIPLAQTQVKVSYTGR